MRILGTKGDVTVIALGPNEAISPMIDTMHLQPEPRLVTTRGICYLAIHPSAMKDEEIDAAISAHRTRAEKPQEPHQDPSLSQLAQKELSSCRHS
jgi:hypothetical protein